MLGRKIKISVLLVLFTTSLAFCQSEVLKPVVNNLAYYKQKKDLKYLAAAKKSIDSLITNHADSADTKKIVYRAVVNSTIAYVDSANTLKLPVDFFNKTADLVDKLMAKKRLGVYQSEVEYAKRCIANVYIRRGFVFMSTSDFVNANQVFIKALKYAPSFTQLNFYIAYCSNKLGNMQDAAKYYTYLINADSTQSQYVEALSGIYRSMGDTSKALETVQKGRKLLPNDRLLLLDEANIYNNRKDYHALEPLLGQLLDIYPNNADIAFVAANCYDNLNRYDKAETYYQQAIELNGAAYDPVYNLGLLYFRESLVKTADKQKYIANAIQLLDKANEISPNDIRGLQVLRLVYIQTQNKTQLINVNNKLKQLTNQ